MGRGYDTGYNSGYGRGTSYVHSPTYLSNSHHVDSHVTSGHGFSSGHGHVSHHDSHSGHGIVTTHHDSYGKK